MKSALVECSCIIVSACISFLLSYCLYTFFEFKHPAVFINVGYVMGLAAGMYVGRSLTYK